MIRAHYEVRHAVHVSGAAKMCPVSGRENVTGTSRRYAKDLDRLMDDRIAQRIAVENPLQSLTEQERRTGMLPPTSDPQPKRCNAWFRFGPHAMQIEGVVVKWNDLACDIQFTVGDRELECWVWANAVTPLG